MFRACAVVPSRNHYRAMAEIVSRLSASGLHVFVIDDGSDEPARSTLARLHEPDRGVDVIRLPPKSPIPLSARHSTMADRILVRVGVPSKN